MYVHCTWRGKKKKKSVAIQTNTSCCLQIVQTQARVKWKRPLAHIEQDLDPSWWFPQTKQSTPEDRQDQSGHNALSVYNGKSWLKWERGVRRLRVMKWEIEVECNAKIACIICVQRFGKNTVKQGGGGEAGRSANRGMRQCHMIFWSPVDGELWKLGDNGEYESMKWRKPSIVNCDSLSSPEASLVSGKFGCRPAVPTGRYTVRVFCMKRR